MNVFSEIFYSIAGVKRYPEFLKNTKGKVFLYVVLVVLIYFAVSNIRTIPDTMDVVSEVQEAVISFPDFTLGAGKLEMEEPFYYEDEEEGIVFDLDSSDGSYINKYSLSEWYEMLYDYDYALIADETSMVFNGNGEVNIYSFENLSDDFQISRNWVYDKIKYIYTFVIIFLIFSYVFSFIGYFLTALLVALVGMIMCSFMKQKLTFGQLYLLSLYAKTLPLFIKGLLNLIGSSFFGFSLLAFAIACLYVGFAIHNMDMQDEEKKRAEINEPIIF